MERVLRVNLALQISNDDLQIRREFKEHLTTGSAGGTAIARHDRNHIELSAAFAYRLDQRRPLGTDAGGVGRIFDIAAGVDAAV